MYQINQGGSRRELMFLQCYCSQNGLIHLLTIAVIGILLGGALIQPQVAQAADSQAALFQSGQWPYRVALTVNANGHERTDKIVELSINFSQLITQVAETAAFDEQSIRVVEIDSSNNIINANVPFQFDTDAAYNSSTNAVGTLVLQMSGTTSSSGDRLYHIYFGPVGQAYALPAFTPLVLATVSGVQDEGEDSYKFEMASGTYFYQPQSGGFSSIDDIDGNDWINHSPATGTAGKFRGIPNLIHPESGFHPSDGGSTTQIEHTGPIKVTYLTTDGNWQARWEIYPEYVRMTLLQTDHDYWFLYEGTPGGELTTSDRYTFSTGPTQYNAYLDTNNITDSDIPDAEWIYFSDSDVGPAGRSLFLVHHEDDAFPDSYRRLGNTANNNAMTVFGFGRQNLSLFMSQVPQHFTFGLLETVDYAEASTAINGAYQEVSISLGAAETNTTELANQVPTADAGVDQTVTDVDSSGSESITLDGSGSDDSDGEIASYAWSGIADATISNVVNPTIDVPVGSHEVTLTVTDDNGATATDTVSIIVEGAPVLLGDVNCDETVDAVDALFILQFTVDLRTGSGSCPPATSTTQIYLGVGDVNGDGSIAVVDALFILQCLVNTNNVLCPDTLRTEANRSSTGAEVTEIAASSSVKASPLIDTNLIILYAAH